MRIDKLEQAGADMWLRPSNFTLLFSPSVVEKTKELGKDSKLRETSSSISKMPSKQEISTDKAPTFDQTKFPFSQAVSYPRNQDVVARY